MITTTRLRIYPATRETMEAAIAKEADLDLRAAYQEMLDGCLLHPDRWGWYAMWAIELPDGTPIGDLCFKGLGPDGAAEIGYGILEDYQGHGYATEAVAGAVAWAFSHQEVTRLEAETDPLNAASQRVLAKCGFQATGVIGEEGPRFALPRRAFEQTRTIKQ
ncbi:MAG: GNAT family N-acetyltransferase [Clostridia bacterium]|nr:GNAT family N-acetyltransferase [Clostridia bacterium]